ncbi:MAG TPA: carboxyltransferase domain-containing protein [Gemmata sp.]|nr:carboxyltransferase domain-containing protein [Gemmata sp.]
MKLVPLGDQAVLAYLADEPAAVRFAAAVRAANPAWLQDVVPAYASVGVFFNADLIGTDAAIDWLSSLPVDAAPSGTHHSSLITHHFEVPVCYEFAPDLPRVCEHTHLSPDEVIRLHLATEFTIYAIGFVPGFPYMGYLPPELCGVARLASPRVRVEPGSVAITGRQTAIYPQASPGGWNLIGRTPLVIVDVKDGFFPLAVGDRVRFVRIDEKRYRELEGERVGKLSSPGS